MNRVGQVWEYDEMLVLVIGSAGEREHRTHFHPVMYLRGEGLLNWLETREGWEANGAMKRLM